LVREPCGSQPCQSREGRTWRAQCHCAVRTRCAILGTHRCSMQVTNCSGVRARHHLSGAARCPFSSFSHASATANRFPFPSSPFKHAQRRRAPTRKNSRLPFPHTPSHGHVPDGTPIPVGLYYERVRGSLCRPVFLLSLHQKASGQQRRPPAHSRLRRLWRAWTQSPW
jgi:hypothetical protein